MRRCSASNLESQPVLRKNLSTVSFGQCFSSDHASIKANVTTYTHCYTVGSKSAHNNRSSSMAIILLTHSSAGNLLLTSEANLPSYADKRGVNFTKPSQLVDTFVDLYFSDVYQIACHNPCPIIKSHMYSFHHRNCQVLRYGSSHCRMAPVACLRAPILPVSITKM